MMRFSPFVPMAALLLAHPHLSGCASILSASQYGVSIRSEPQGAHFSVRDAYGNLIATGETPGVVVLEASSGFFKGARYTIDYRKGGLSARVVLVAKVDGWYFGNLLLGGLVGMLIIDPATGAMYSLPPQVTGVLSHDVSSADDLRLPVGSLADVPASLRAQLVPIPREDLQPQ